MLDSIYIGITGVRSHQTRINVIANNVANINTTGFKAGRAIFSEVLSSTLRAGDAQREQVAATNPQQSGRGVQVASIDTIQTQGSLKSTGVETDLAIEGDGLFILSGDNGSTKVYTRDGTFSLDPAGRLVDPATGLVVQGNLAKDDGTMQDEMENLVIPLDRESKPEATTEIELSGNLDVSGTDQVWTASTRFGTPARLVSSGVASTDLTGLGDPPQLSIGVTVGGETSAGTFTVPKTSFSDIDELIDGLNAQLTLNDTLKDLVLFGKDETTGTPVLRTIRGGEGVTLEVDNAGAFDVMTALGFTDPPVDGDVAATTQNLNELANVGANLTDGDIIRFSGVKPTGERFEGSFTFDRTNNNTVAALFQTIQQAYGDVNVAFDQDTFEIQITDQNTNDTIVGFDIKLSLLDSAAIPTLSSGLLGDDPLTSFSTNTQVFDEKGDVHSLTITFTKSVIANQWVWAATVDGESAVEGGNGKVVFNEDGTLDGTLEAADSKPLRFRPDGGTPDLVISLGGSGTDRLGGLTQFVAPSTVAVREQDGRAAGSLVSINIEANGNIVGTFTNGDSKNLARVLLASFNNPGGLRRTGDNLFTKTEASGDPLEAEAQTKVQGSIISGSIELSNVDLAEQFTNLIVTQRGFQASARSITTADELMAELVNLKR